MDVGINVMANLARGGIKGALALFGSPLRFRVLEGRERSEVLREVQPPPIAIPRLVPDDLVVPPPVEMFDADNLCLSIENVAREHGWLPVDKDRVVVHVYNKSDDAVFFKEVRAEARVVPNRERRTGCIIQLGAGGTVAKVFGLTVGLHTDRECVVSANLDVNEQNLISCLYQLEPRKSLYLIVDVYVGLDDTAPIVDWCLWFNLDANRGFRSSRQTRLPAKRKYTLRRRQFFRIVNGAGLRRYITVPDGSTFVWKQEPPPAQ